MEQNNLTHKAHSIFIEDRKKAVLTGICEIISFDENEIRMELEDTELVIQGEELKIDSFSNGSGDVSVSGVIDSATYLSRKQNTDRRGMLKRLFSND